MSAHDHLSHAGHAVHGHDHHDHSHGAHGHHHHHGPVGSRAYLIALAINALFVVAEAVAGVFAHSTALLADAGHNASDVLALGLSAFAAWLAERPAQGRRTYGYGKAAVLAALANGLMLMAACGAIAWEAVHGLAAPAPVAAPIVIAVAAAGILVNGGTALLFARGDKGDVNARGAFLHLFGDAAVSAGVIVAGVVVALSGASWIDPLASIVIVGFILWSTWGLLRHSLDLALDAAPEHIDVSAVRAALAALPGVAAVHDLHVWAIAPSEAALTAHLVRPEGSDDAFLAQAGADLQARFAITHVTLQVERVAPEACAMGDCS